MASDKEKILKEIKFTPEQEAKFPEYIAKWSAIGLSTEPLDYHPAKRWALEQYRQHNSEAPRTFIATASPLSSAIAQMLMRRDGLWQKLQDYPRLSFQQIIKFAWREPAGLPRSPKEYGITSKVSSYDVTEIFESFNAEDRAKIVKEAGLQGFGNHDAPWLAFYDIVRHELGEIEATQDEAALLELAKYCGWWLPLSHTCWLQDRPCEIHITNGMLHNPDGFAVGYSDGFGVCFIRGTVMPKYICHTPGEKLDVISVLKEPNAQVRAEGIAKIGMERVIYKTNPKVLDEEGDYQLLDIREAVGSTRPWTYLKMANPSVPELWHVEGVGEQCRSIKEALHWRLPEGARRLPVDDENGSDWYQQGDLVIYPKKATSLKSRPCVLT